MHTPRYPNVRVKLLGKRANALEIVTKVRRALERARVPPKEVNEFLETALSGNYDKVLGTCDSWVRIS